MRRYELSRPATGSPTGSGRSTWSCSDRLDPRTGSSYRSGDASDRLFVDPTRVARGDESGDPIGIVRCALPGFDPAVQGARERSPEQRRAQQVELSHTERIRRVEMLRERRQLHDFGQNPTRARARVVKHRADVHVHVGEHRSQIRRFPVVGIAMEEDDVDRFRAKCPNELREQARVREVEREVGSPKPAWICRGRPRELASSAAVQIE